jgi:putative membrane protein insertion efficiency factor
MKTVVLFLIRCYKFVSQTFPPRCRFHPSCSSYAYQAIEIYGFVKGFYLSVKRILKCHPFAIGGMDPVPLPKKKI